MHVLDYVLDRLSSLFRFHNYALVEKAYVVMLYIAGLSLRDLSERYSVTNASREGVRRWFHRFSRLFSLERRVRRAVAVDETVVKVYGVKAYIWSAVDIDSGEVLAIYASWTRNMMVAMRFIKMVLKVCDSKPVIVVDRGPWYLYALKRLGLNYVHETFGSRNRVERFFGYLKQRTKKFHNNINTRNIESIVDFATATATIINLLKTIRLQGGVIPS